MKKPTRPRPPAAPAKTLVQQNTDFTAEGAPPPGTPRVGSAPATTASKGDAATGGDVADESGKKK